MINFLRYRIIYLLISTSILFFGFYSMIKWGFNFSIEFTGGTLIEYQVKDKFEIKIIKKILQENRIETLQLIKENQRLILKTKPISRKQEKKIKEILEKKLKTKVTVLKSETVGPTIGEQMIRKTITASILAILGILFYISFAFKNFNFALAAILAMVHDFFVLLGSYSFLSHFFNAQFDTMFVTALLTTMSFSVHDTIVIFDKIREYFNEEIKKDLIYCANRALNETLIRSLNNSMTIIFMLLALVILGGETIKFFALALLIGIIAGTYSSPFVATPLLIILNRKK